MDAISIIYANNHKRYGYRRITLQLKNEGWTVNHKTVKRLMSKLNLYGITPRAKYKSYKGDFNGTVDNKLLYKRVDTKKHRTEYIRDFSTSGVNEKWTTDVSEFHIAAGKLYLSPILDMHNREIVSYNISRSPGFMQTIDMLDKAFNRFPDLSNLIFHSDQGWQYQMFQYHKALEERGITQSMSRKGNCLDNSPMENFFGKMKNEMFYGHEYEFKTLGQLQEAMEEYIEYYNNERIQVKLKGLTPCQARNQSLYSF
jgi:transposase InsO family protein